MKVSLIVTTYNWKEALRLSLLSAFEQSTLPDEIIVADDGSSDGTDAMIEELRQLSPVPLIHSWQEDEGFRAARSRNLAISKASSEYIVMIDGDMLLHRHFIKDHMACATKNCFLQGSRVLMDAGLTRQRLHRESLTFPSIWDKGLKNRTNGLYIPLLSQFICRKTMRRHKSIRSCNFSCYREDVLSVNGFNEDFVTWGREDSELAERLYNKGVRRKNLKFSGIQYHLYHKEGSSNSGNDALLQAAIDQRLAWCENGIDKHLTK